MLTGQTYGRLILTLTTVAAFLFFPAIITQLYYCETDPSSITCLACLKFLLEYCKFILELFKYLNYISPKINTQYREVGDVSTELSRIRSFNRFYTQKIGLITNRFLKSNYSLVQARILFELQHHGSLFAKDLSQDLGLSPDYLSKTVTRFKSLGLVKTAPSPDDSRKQAISLTKDGTVAYETLQQTSNAHIEAMIQDLQPEQKTDLLASMNTIQGILGRPDHSSSLLVLRSHRPGDLGYVVHRHGVLYAREYGFNHEFDAYVARGMADFIDGFDEQKEHFWVADSGHKFAGSVAVVKKDEKTAQLRWLIVEPDQRGQGIGKKLTDQAVRFAREKQYDKIILWTIDFLDAARRIYANAGFSLSETRESAIWGRLLKEEKWEIKF